MEKINGFVGKRTSTTEREERINKILANPKYRTTPPTIQVPTKQPRLRIVKKPENRTLVYIKSRTS